MPLSDRATCIQRIAQDIADKTKAEAAAAAAGATEIDPPLTLEEVLKALAAGPRPDGDNRAWDRFEGRTAIARMAARGVLLDRYYSLRPPVVVKLDADRGSPELRPPTPPPDPDLIDSIVEAVIDSIEARGIRFPELRTWLAGGLAELGYTAGKSKQ